MVVLEQEVGPEDLPRSPPTSAKKISNTSAADKVLPPAHGLGHTYIALCQLSATLLVPQLRGGRCDF